MLLAEIGATAFIDATDFDPRALANAQNGEPYRENEVGGVPTTRREKYFEIEGDLYRIKPSVLDVVRFRKMNLFTDDFPSGSNLIICRNLVIYFTGEVKAELFQRFRGALAGGILFLGATETALNAEMVGFTHQIGNFFLRVETAQKHLA